MKLINIAFATFILLFYKSTTAQRINVKSIEWKKAGGLPENNGQLLGLAGVVAGVSNDVFIAGGGSNFPDSMPWLGGKKKYYDDLYLYKKNQDDSLVFFRSLKLPFPLGYGACVSTSKGIVIAGGENEKGISKKVLLLQWDTATQKIITDYLPDLPNALTGATIACNDGTVYVAGGDMGNACSNHLLSLNLNDPTADWIELPHMPYAASHAVFVFQENDSALYFIGGRKKNQGKPSTLYKGVYAYDLKSGKWENKHPLPYALSAGTGVASKNKIILFGGDAGETFHKTEELIFAIANEENENRKKQLNSEKMKVQSGHPGFCGNELVYDVDKNNWKKAGCIPFDVPVTTIAVPWKNEVIIPGGEIRAGVRTPQIISAQIIFE